MSDRVFFDTNVVLYLVSRDDARIRKAEDVILQGGVVSVQVLNECANAALKRLGRSWAEVKELIALIMAVCEIVPLTIETHERGLILAESYRLSVYDGMIWAAAILSGCSILYSEDMHHGLKIGGTLLQNPFLGLPTAEAR